MNSTARRFRARTSSENLSDGCRRKIHGEIWKSFGTRLYFRHLKGFESGFFFSFIMYYSEMEPRRSLKDLWLHKVRASSLSGTFSMENPAENKCGFVWANFVLSQVIHLYHLRPGGLLPLDSNADGLLYHPLLIILHHLFVVADIFHD